jgi:hypothetical protein
MIRMPDALLWVWILTLGRELSGSNMTEEFLNFWIKQSRPWIATDNIRLGLGSKQEGRTSIRDLGALIAAEALPFLTGAQLDELHPLAKNLMIFL